MDLTQLFCDIDDFVKALEGKNDQQLLISRSKSKRGFPPQMYLSELMAIIVMYHSSGFKNFKHFYFYLRQNMKAEFPRLLSYSRFVELMPYCLIPLCTFLKTRKGTVTGISYIDSTSLSVCRNIRIPRNKVFKGIATRGKTTMGWFFGFKLHIIVNEIGELLAFKITKGNTHDQVPVRDLCKGITGKLFGDKGYLSNALFKELFENGLSLFTNIRSNMKNKFLLLEDKILLRKRFIIETINDQLKNICDIEHSRHRSPTNFMVNLIAGLISYSYREKKPAIRGSNGPKLLNY
jgi:hypothetical protein